MNKPKVVGYMVKDAYGYYLQKGCTHFGKKPHIWPSKNVICGRLKCIKNKNYLDAEDKERLLNSNFVPVYESKEKESMLFSLDCIS